MSAVRDAYDALDAFGQRAGRVPLLLLLHASVPQSFRADLINLLKTNFLANEPRTDLSVDADVLLSSLVQPAAAGYYRLDPEVRRHGLALLDAAYRDDAERRSVQVARLLVAYADALDREAALALDPLLAEYLAIQRWVALAFLDPSRAAEGFARAIAQGLDRNGSAATLRLGSVTAAVSIPLTGHHELLAYARGVEALATGDAATGRRLLDALGHDELRVGGVTLRPLNDARPRAGHAETEPLPGPVLISYAMEDHEAAVRLAEALRAEGVQVLVGSDERATGEQLEKSLRDDVERCVLFIAVLSRYSVTAESRVFRREWDHAFDRWRRMPANRLFLLPVVIDDVPRNDLGLPHELTDRQWTLLPGGTVTPQFIGTVKKILRENRGRALLIFGAPSPTVLMVGREREVAALRELLVLSRPQAPSAETVDAEAQPPARIVALVGPDGIGKWTLASHMVSAVAEHFTDGIVWLGEDGAGYPTEALRAYAESAGVTTLVDERGLVDREAFRHLFANRRVLFVADQRSTSDIVPTLYAAGPDCVILRLLTAPPTENVLVITLEPLADAAALEMLARGGTGGSAPRDIVRLAEGRPLFLRLLCGLVRTRSIAGIRDNLLPDFGTGVVSDRVRIHSLVTHCWEVLDRDERGHFRTLVAALGNGTLMGVDALPAETRRSVGVFEELGLIDVTASVIRMQRAVKWEAIEIAGADTGNTPGVRTSESHDDAAAGDAPPNRIPSLEVARERAAAGDRAGARRLYEARLRMTEEVDNRAERAATLSDMAALSVADGDPAEALKLYKAAWDLANALRDMGAVGRIGESFGRLLLASGVASMALTILEESRRAYEQDRREDDEARIRQMMNLPDTEEARRRLWDEIRLPPSGRVQS